ncbi:Tfp pilus assembly protein PilF [Desulfuromonas soudanensis]|uniref:Tfp pilus assembly protein PilF n=2 Tax=Desulfuromonas soudanensis TaxID=1603606 RepID=A0A0M5IKJ0_9BACT|nr:Tfp pilus assembly protein PilF [Desulfuromonas soudanensis]
MARWLYPLLLLLMVCGVYANSFPGNYFLDDYVVVQTNPLVSEPDVVEIFLTDYWGPDVNSGLHRPLVILSFALKHWLFGPAPLADHLLNVLLHALVSLLIYLTLRRWQMGQTVAWLTAALFAVHPIHTEVVNEAVGRAELLAALGVLLVLYVARAVAGWWRYPLLVLSFLFGVLAKENAVTVLALLPLLDGFRRNRGVAVWWHRHWRDYVCLSGTALAWLALRNWGVQRWVPRDAADPFYTPLKLMEPIERVLTALQIQWLYLWKQLYPADLRGIYSGGGYLLPVDTPWSLLGMVVLVASLVVLVAGVWLYRRGSVAGLSVLLYACAFAPTANIFFATGATMAERLAYLPSVWFCLGLAGVLVQLTERTALSRLGLGFCVFVLLGYSGRTLVRNNDFASPLALWEADVHRDPLNITAWMYLANRYWEAKELTKSEVAFRQALQLGPEFTEALFAYASFLLEQKRFDEALELALHAEGLKTSDMPNLYMLVADIYLELGNPQEAGRWLEKARWRYAQDDYFLFLQGWVYEALGDVTGAVASYRQIKVPLEQWRLDARLSTFLLNQGDYPGAEAFLRRSLKLGETAETWNNLGIALALQGKAGEAKAAFSRAMQLDPDKPGYSENYQRIPAVLPGQRPGNSNP